MAKKMNVWDYLALIVLIVSGIAWLPMIWGQNWVAMLGQFWHADKIIYFAAVASGVYTIVRFVTK